MIFVVEEKNRARVRLALKNFIQVPVALDQTGTQII